MLKKSVTKIALAAAAAIPTTVLACGEMMFNAGQGLPFQSYRAPQPADVLVLWTDARHDNYYSELIRAGHRITLVIDAEDMRQELAQHDFDIVIADFDSLNQVPASVAENSGSGPRLLPIVARNLRKSPEVRDRFAQIFVDGASVGQFLTTINRVLKSMI